MAKQKSTTKVCKNCGTEIPTYAKMCPNCFKKQGGGKAKIIIPLIAVAFVVCIIISSLFSSQPSNDDSYSQADTPSVTDNSNTDNKNNTYKIGDTVNISAIYGNYNLTIKNVKTSSQRNEFADKQPKKIVIIEYSYENIDCTQDITISSLYFHAYDNDGNLLENYPSTEVEMPNTISAGGKKTASFAVGLDSDTNIIKLQFYNVDYSDMAHPECAFNFEW